jgi:hypothetical protein
MPRCANATGVVDEVLPLPSLTARLSTLLARAPDAPQDKTYDRGGQS